MRTESDGNNIRRYYIECAQKLIDEYESPVVLKTDLYNESHIQRNVEDIIEQLKGYKEIHAIEIDERTYAEALKLHEHRPSCYFKHGSIVDLPYEDNMFDILLDLSTLDHVPQSEAELVLKGYARVIKRGGSFLLFLWTRPDADGDKENTLQQYCYNEERFINSLNKEFIILEQGDALHSEVLGVLKRYKCKVRK